MRIGATEAKGADASNAALCLPGSGLCWHADERLPFGCVEADTRIGLIEVEMGRDGLMLKRKNEFDQSRNTRCPF